MSAATPRQALNHSLKQKSNRLQLPSCGAVGTATPTLKRENTTTAPKHMLTVLASV